MSNTTVWKWMQNIGFTYDERRKSYFSDKHEAKRMFCQGRSLKFFFDLERRMHRWVQIPESLAIEMEEDNKKPLMRDFF